MDFTFLAFKGRENSVEILKMVETVVSRKGVIS